MRARHFFGFWILPAAATGMAPAAAAFCLRLPLAAAYLNEHLGDGAAVSVASLYEAAKLGRRVHRRWAVKRTPVADTAAAFEEVRRSLPTAKAVVLIHPMRMAVVERAADQIFSRPSQETKG